MNKYIKIYEAFESQILSSLLKYIKPSDKNTFLDLIKKICKEYNFPISKLSDDFFYYLPFNKALKKTDSLDSISCDSKSIDLFGKYGIEGEVCNKGLIKRKWGNSTRKVRCEKCSGTGIKPKGKEITLFKFWFKSDGEYIGTTCFNNNISISNLNYSKNINDYTIEIEDASNDDLKNGDIVLFQQTPSREPIFAYIIKINDRCWAIQNECNGDKPGIDFSEFGDYSWSLGGGDTYRVSLLKEIDKDKESEEIDPFSYNLVYNFRYMRIDNKSSKEFLKDANFSIVFDVDKLAKSKFKKTNLTRDERSTNKKGASYLLSNEEIKNTNLDRYVEEISKRMNIYKNRENCNKLINKILNRDYLLFEQKSINIVNYIDRLINAYYNILSTEDRDENDYYKVRYINDLDDINRSVYNYSRMFSIKINKIILNFRIKLENNSRSEYFVIIEKIIEINRIFYDKLMAIDIENIDDLSLVVAKMKSFISFFNNSKFEDSIYSYLLDYLCDEDYNRAIYKIESYDIQEKLEKLERIKRMVIKL